MLKNVVITGKKVGILKVDSDRSNSNDSYKMESFGELSFLLPFYLRKKNPFAVEESLTIAIARTRGLDDTTRLCLIIS